MLYRGSDHGWASSELGNRVKKLNGVGKNNLLMLLKINNGNSIGGFTSVEAVSEEKSFIDKDAFLFNLT